MADDSRRNEMTFKFIVPVSDNEIFKDWTGNSLIGLKGFFNFSKVGPDGFLNNINQVIKETKEDIIIVAHQDLKFNPEFLTELWRQIDSLDLLGICGVAGYGLKGDLCSSLRFRDHCTGVCGTGLGKSTEVQTLDGLLLIFKNYLGFSISSDILKRDLYGEDLCLQAIQRDFHNYILNLKIEHRSKGGFENEPRFLEDLKRFREKWKDFSSPIFSTTIGQLK